eukprot:6184685-Pleurochrysis_carterae.AAC.1
MAANAFVFKQGRLLGQGSTAAVYLATAEYDLNPECTLPPWTLPVPRPALLQVRDEADVLMHSTPFMNLLHEYATSDTCWNAQA